MTTGNPVEKIAMHPDQRRKLLAQRLREKARESKTMIPVTAAQRGVWFMQQVDPATHAYHLCFCVYVHSAINRVFAKAALQQLIDRHSMLRTTFRSNDDKVEMLVHGAGDANFAESDTGKWTDEQLHQNVELSFRHPFDLENGPLVRMHLFSRSETEHVLLFVLHHLICDGWSLGRLLTEFMECYRAELSSRTPRLETMAVDYPAFVLQHEQRLTGNEGERSKAWWLEKLGGGDIPPLNLPTSHRRNEFTPDSSAFYSFEVDEALCSQLAGLARECGVTLFGVLLAAYQTFLMRLCGQQDVLVGVPMTGRVYPGCDTVIGHFVNLVPVRARLDADVSFRAFLDKTWHELQGAIQHQEYPFVELVRILKPSTRAERTPLFRTTLNILRTASDQPMSCVLCRDPESMLWGSLQISHFPLEPIEEQYDLAVRIVELKGRLQVRLQYDRTLFEAELVEHFGQCLHELFRSLIADPDRLVSQLTVLAPAQRHQMLVEWNATSAEYPRDLALHQLLEQQAASTPDSTALSFGESKLSYRQIDRQANQMARYLRQSGIGRNDLVAVCAERSPELVIGLLGILKAGAAYVPIDPKFPADRVEHMLQDSGARLVFTTQTSDASIAAITNVPRFCLDRDTKQLAPFAGEGLSSITDPLDLAYVIYTSGSTGWPKGVQISHRAVVNFLFSMRNRPGLTASDVLLSVTTCSFDIFGLELFLPLMVGARLELANGDEIVDGELLLARLRNSGATVMQATPITWRMLLAAGFRSTGKFKALCGGEVLPPDLARQLLNTGVELWNMYGPTETTIWSCVEQVREANGQPISVGRPIANTYAYVLDSQRQPVPVGVAGQLYLGGDGLARGYLRRPELTAEKFVINPFTSDQQQRMYDTGDLARYLPDGRLECLGRSDHQIKIRGYRIELEEIQAVLCKHNSISQAVVTLREDRPGNPQLVAYCVPAPNSVETSGAELRTWLKTQLPEYMIPVAFVSVPALPVTPNGKIDRNKLPVPQFAAPSVTSNSSSVVRPLKENEQALCDIWKEVLGLSEISPEDNFFDIGGHSLLAIRLMHLVKERLGRTVALAKLFSAPTVAEFAKMLADHTDAATKSTATGGEVLPLRPAGKLTPLFCVPGVGGLPFTFNPLIPLLDPEQPVYGLHFPWVEMQTEIDKIESLAAACVTQIRQTHPHGPYRLAGYSFGSTVAFEMAQQLLADHQEVELLVLFDGFAPGAMQKRPRWQRILLRMRHMFRRRPAAAIHFAVESAKGFMRDALKIPIAMRVDALPVPAPRIQQTAEKAWDRYRPHRYTGDVLLLQAMQLTEDLELLDHGPANGWAQYLDHIQVHRVPGTHWSMFEKPHIYALARELNRCLENLPSTMKSASK